MSPKKPYRPPKVMTVPDGQRRLAELHRAAALAELRRKARSKPPPPPSPKKSPGPP